MSKFLIAGQILIALLLISFILLQGRGTGLSAPFGGGGETFRTRRGVEKVLHYLTIFVVVLFTLSLLLGILS